MRSYYIKKYRKISKFDVWIVDGNYIRTKIDMDFTNFDHHYCCSYIPKNEFWIDDAAVKGEEEYYIKHLLIEYKLMKEGMSYNDASDEASIIEIKARENSKLFREIKKLPKKEIIKKIHKALLEEYSKKIKIWIVNGKMVRDLLFIKFTAGGHDKVYSFIPKNEIWIDDCIFPEERKFVVLHELYERKLICDGKIYDTEEKERKSESAHLAANELELFYRKHPKNINKRINGLLE